MSKELVRVKLTTPFPDWPLLRQTPNSEGIWGDYQFFVNRDDVEECDFWIVCEGLLREETAICPPGNTFFVTWEPPTLKSYTPRFLAQFAAVITCQRELKHRNVIYSQQAHPWFVGKNYDELKSSSPIHKSKMLSVICSDKQFTEGHRKRFQFAQKLKEHFGDDVDLFGRGIRDFEDKWDTLAPYKYTIAIENLAYPDWVTEKLPDCYLAESFPFYYGCTNVEKYFSPDSMALIDIDDFDHSIKVIEDILSDESHYERVRPCLAAARNDYLDRYSLFPHLAFFLDHTKSSHPQKESKKMRIHPENSFQPVRLKSKVKSGLRAIKNRVLVKKDR